MHCTDDFCCRAFCELCLITIDWNILPKFIVHLLCLIDQECEIVRTWLAELHLEEYWEMFITAGYDMPTISRMTPEVSWFLVDRSMLCAYPRRIKFYALRPARELSLGAIELRVNYHFQLWMLMTSRRRVVRLTGPLLELEFCLLLKVIIEFNFVNSGIVTYMWIVKLVNRLAWENTVSASLSSETCPFFLSIIVSRTSRCFNF